MFACATDILSALMMLVEVSENFGDPAAQKLGHFYFILRDAPDPNADNEVYNQLFHDDGNTPRNIQRARIAAAFKSRTVFCCGRPHPVNTVIESPNFCLEQCNVEFAHQILAIRRHMAEQMNSTPHLLQENMPLTGVTIAETVNVVVEALNSKNENENVVVVEALNSKNEVVFSANSARAIQEKILEAAFETAMNAAKTVIAEKLQSPCDPADFPVSLGLALDDVKTECRKHELVNPAMFEGKRLRFQAELSPQIAKAIEQNNDTVQRAFATIEQEVCGLAGGVQNNKHNEEDALVAAWDAHMVQTMSAFKTRAYEYMKIQNSIEEWNVYKVTYDARVNALHSKCKDTLITFLRSRANTLRHQTSIGKIGVLIGVFVLLCSILTATYLHSQRIQDAAVYQDKFTLLRTEAAEKLQLLKQDMQVCHGNLTQLRADLRIKTAETAQQKLAMQMCQGNLTQSHSQSIAFAKAAEKTQLQILEQDMQMCHGNLTQLRADLMIKTAETAQQKLAMQMCQGNLTQSHSQSIAFAKAAEKTQLQILEQDMQMCHGNLTQLRADLMVKTVETAQQNLAMQMCQGNLTQVRLESVANEEASKLTQLQQRLDKDFIAAMYVNNTDAADRLLEAAKKTNHLAEGYLAICYFFGNKLFTRDVALSTAYINNSTNWLEAELLKNNRNAQFLKGFYLLNGVGIMKHPRREITYLFASSELGHSGAQYTLGLCGSFSM